MDARIRPTLAAYDPELAQRHDAAVAFLCQRIERRIQNVTAQLSAPHEPLAFDSNGIAYLTNATDWVPSLGAALQVDTLFNTRRRTTAFTPTSPSEVHLERVSQDGKSLLQVGLGSQGGTGSWRQKVLLNHGNYRLEGRARVAKVSDRNRICLRISGERAFSQVATDTEWKSLSYPFVVGPFVSEIWLICEFSGSEGEAWFDPESFHLVRE
jgi:hypothetical protein